MGTVLFILVLSAALLALIAGGVAIRAWLSFRRARLNLQWQLSEDVARLASRTIELEQSVAALDARTKQLPVSISSLQENLDALQILTRTLASSLRQAQKLLSYSALKTFSATHLADSFPSHSGRTRQ